MVTLSDETLISEPLLDGTKEKDEACSVDQSPLVPVLPSVTPEGTNKDI